MTVNKKELIQDLKNKSCDMRQTILTMIHEAGSGHPGGSLSAADIVTALYFYEMKIDPQNPKWDGRDRFVLSKGHACPVLYSALILKGYMPKEEVYTLRKYGSKLQGHPDMKKTPGVDISTGSLGQGISAAVGMALGLKRDKKDNKVFVLVGDGESQEGQVWESMQVASKYCLDNLTIVIDENRIQNDGFCADIMPVGSIADKVRAFGCHTVEINGHSMEEIVGALDEIRDVKGKPKCIVAQGVKGKGVSFMEDVPKWHGVAPNDEEFEQAMKEVKEASL